MKNLTIELFGHSSEYINNVKENFKYSKAYKYLDYFKQENNKCYTFLKDIEEAQEEIAHEFYHIVEIEARGYCQSEWQEFTFYFQENILKDKEAMEEIKYLKQDLQYYFTAYDLQVNGSIEHVKVIDGKDYIHTEQLKGIYITILDYNNKENIVKDFLNENGLKEKDFNIIYDEEKENWK